MKCARVIVVMFLCVNLLGLPLGLDEDRTLIQAKTTAPGKAKWTIMIYGNCDCNLEAEIVSQLSKLTAIGGNKDVNIVLLIDRSSKGEEVPGYSSIDMGNIKNWTGAKVLQAQKDEFREIADLGKINMSSPEILFRFAAKTASDFPAEKYALILGGHGMGWVGVCPDDSENGEQLTLPALSAALAAFSKEFGKFEVVGFDACLMADVETVHAVSRHARYMIASQELESGLGWDFPPLINALRNSPGMDGKDFGSVVCDAFKEQFDKGREMDLRKLSDSVSVTLSVIDLSTIDDLMKAVDAFADRVSVILKEQEDKGWIKLARARSRAENYGLGAGENASFQSRDLGHLCDLVRKQEADAGPVCDALDRALKTSVVKWVHGKGVPNSRGISIYFPRDGKFYTPTHQKAYSLTSFGDLSRWTLFLKKYIAIADGSRKQPGLKDLKVSKEVFSHNDGERVTVSANVVDPDLLDRAQFTISQKLGKHKVVIGQETIGADDDGELRMKWDGLSYHIVNGQERVPCPFVSMEELEDEENVFVVEIRGQVLKKGRKDWLDVTLRFILDISGDEATGEFVDASMETKNGLRNLTLRRGDEIRMTFLAIDDKGKETRLYDNFSIKINKLSDLTIGLHPVPKGIFFLGYSITDFNGLNDMEDHEVVVKDYKKNE